MNQETLLTATQVATLLDCHVETIEAATREGRLPAVKFGKAWRYPNEALLKVLNEQALKAMERKAPKPAPMLVQPVQRNRRVVPPQLPAIASRAEKS